MEQETATPGRGSDSSAAWFRAQLDLVGLGQSALAREMAALGDDRQFDTIIRNLRRMASGEARVSGEMRALLRLIQQKKMLERELELLRSGQMRSFENRGLGEVDTSAQSTTQVEHNLGETKEAIGIIASAIPGRDE